MKPQTICCHVCRTSLNQCKREFMPCTDCNRIVCRNCFGTRYKAQTWVEAQSKRDTWICPSCQGHCPCSRCKKKTRPYNSQGLKRFKKYQAQQLAEDHFDESSLSFEDENQDSCLELRTSDDSFSIESSFLSCSPSPFKFPIIPTMLPYYQQLMDLSQREEKCESMIQQMERFMELLEQEKLQIHKEKIKLQHFLQSS